MRKKLHKTPFALFICPVSIAYWPSVIIPVSIHALYSWPPALKHKTIHMSPCPFHIETIIFSVWVRSFKIRLTFNFSWERPNHFEMSSLLLVAICSNNQTWSFDRLSNRKRCFFSFLQFDAWLNSTATSRQDMIDDGRTFQIIKYTQRTKKSGGHWESRIRFRCGARHVTASYILITRSTMVVFFWISSKRKRKDKVAI